MCTGTQTHLSVDSIKYKAQLPFSLKNVKKVKTVARQSNRRKYSTNNYMTDCK